MWTGAARMLSVASMASVGCVCGAVTAPEASSLSDPPPRINKPPHFTWDTLGGMTFAHVTKSTEFNATDLALLKKYCIVQFDKGQNDVSMPAATLEDRFIAAARQVKQVNPKATLLMYLNGMIDFPEFQRLHNTTVAQPSLLVHNSDGQLAMTLAPYGTFDMRNAAMRQLFVSDAVYGVKSGAFDGVFIDRANWAQRGYMQLTNGTSQQEKSLRAHHWEPSLLSSLVPAQTQLFRDLTTALGPDAVVLAKETGGGAPFLDWKVANAAMSTDTFCSSYAPAENVPAGAGGTWATPVQGHMRPWQAVTMAQANTSTFAKCEIRCDRTPGCQAVQYNTQIRLCWLLNETINKRLYCMNGTGVEWVANRAAPGVPTCSPTAAPNMSYGYDAAQCLEDMQTVAAAATRGQLTENHGQGPPGDIVSRTFTIGCFLVSAGNLSYFSHASWLKGGAWSLEGTEWWPEYDYPLGEPVDPPLMPTPGSTSGRQFSRRFGSGTAVTLDLDAQRAHIAWARP